MSVEISITDQIVEINEVSNPVEISVTAGAAIAPVWGGITGTLSNQIDLQNALNAKVPYTGATANVDLGEFELKAGQIEYDQTPTGFAGVAVTRWNDSTGTIETTLKGGSVVLEHGRDMFERIVNKTGIQLTKAAYQAVRISDAQGQRLAVQLAQANNDNNSADTIGLVVETIANNQEGYIYTIGEIEGINTTGSLQGETWVDGDVLYLSPTIAGRITNIKPVAPQHLVVIGYVVYAHANNGKIYVKVMNGWELGELHDVNTNGATIGQVLKYNGTIWTPSSDTGITSLNGLTALSQTFATGTSGTDFNISSATNTHTFNLPSASATNRGLLTSADWTTFNNKQNALTNPVTGTGVAGQVAYWSGTNTQAGSNNLFWDATNNRLRINTQFLAGNEQSFNVYGSALFQQSIGDAQKIYIGNNTSLPTGDGRLLITPNQIKLNDRLTALLINADNLNLGASITLNGRDSDAGSLLMGASGNTAIKIFATTRNIAIQNGGTFTDSGQRLQVIGDTLMRGSGNTSATTALTVQNSDGTNVLNVRNDGSIQIGSRGATQRPYFAGYTGFSEFGAGQSTLGIVTQFLTTNRPDPAVLIKNSANLDYTSGTGNFLSLLTNYSPTSGTGVFNNYIIQPTINQTGGANGITRGLYVNPTLTAAADWRSIEWSNNTGWGLYGAGTSDNFIAGKLGIGSTTLTANSLRISRAQTGATSINTILSSGQINSDVTVSVNNFASQLITQAATFTLGQFTHFRASDTLQGAGSTITQNFGFRVDDLTFGTSDFGFYGDVSSGTNKWNLYMNGTAANYFGGTLSIGTTNPSQGLRIGLAPTLANSTSVFLNVAIPNTVTTIYRGFATSIGLNATGFTLPNLSHFEAINDGTHTAGVVTNLYGFRENLGTYNATNVYGFFGNIASGTGRWNLYMNGTADNYLAGNTVIGNTTTALVNYGREFIVSGVGKPTEPEGFVVIQGNRTTSNNNVGALAFYNVSDQIASIAGRREGANNTGRLVFSVYNAGVANSNTILSQLGNLLLGSTTDSGERLQVNGTMRVTGASTFSSSVTSTLFRLSALNTAPTSSTDTGTLGEIRIDANFIYICTATNTWKRVAIATW